MAYKIANLVQFYLVTMQRTIGVDAVLTQALSEYDYLPYFAPIDTDFAPLVESTTSLNKPSWQR